MTVNLTVSYVAYDWLHSKIELLISSPAHSLAHGAGRRHARATLHSGSKHSKSSLTTTSLGSEVICTDPDLLIEEMPDAYKDVGNVVEDMEDKGICKGVVVLRPLVTYKIREAAEGRK